MNSDTCYEVSSLRSCFKTPLFAELFNDWKVEEKVNSFQEAEDYIERVHRRQYNTEETSRTTKKDGIVRIVLEVKPMWPAEERDNWESYNNGYFGRNYMHFKIKSLTDLK